MSTSPSFTALVGQLESAFGAILDRELAGTGLSAPHWITLTVAIAGGGSIERDQLVHRVSRAPKITEPEVETCINELAHARLLLVPDQDGAPVTVKDAGRQLHSRISTAVADITQRL